jgi:hypothetical protein
MASSIGESGDSLLKKLQEVSQGTISNQGLLASASRAFILGVAKDGDELAKILEVAVARGQSLGVSAEQAFSDIVLGIGRMSPEILDNLGIVTDGQATFKAYAEAIGKTTEELTEAEKKQALINKVINEGASATTFSASAWEQLTAAMANASDVLAAKAGPSLTKYAQQAADIINQAIAAQEEYDRSLADADLWQRGAQITFETGQLDLLREASKALQVGTPEWLRMERAIIDTTDRIVAFGEEYNAAAQITGAPMIDLDHLRQGVVGFYEAGDAMTEVGSDAAAAAAEVETLVKEILKVDASKKSISDVVQGRLFDLSLKRAGGDYVKAIGSNEQQSMDIIRQANLLMLQGGKDLEYRDQVIIPSLINKEQDYQRSIEKTSTAVTKVNEEYRKLESSVSSVLSNALDPGVGVDPDKLLEEKFAFRESAINENARRLADLAVNGFKDQGWLDEFKAQAPNIWEALRLAQNPQEEAAFMLREFQDGLRPELIDKDRAKDLVRRMLLGDQNMAELAKEIALELAGEMGISVDEALGVAKSALGVKGGGGLDIAGADAGTAIIGGAEAEALASGDKIAGGLIEALSKTFERLTQAGRDAGNAWGDGFLEKVGEGVPAALITILTNLITPGVEAKLAAASTLTGAE